MIIPSVFQDTTNTVSVPVGIYSNAKYRRNEETTYEIKHDAVHTTHCIPKETNKIKQKNETKIFKTTKVFKKCLIKMYKLRKQYYISSDQPI